MHIAGLIDVSMFPDMRRLEEINVEGAIYGLVVLFPILQNRFDFFVKHNFFFIYFIVKPLGVVYQYDKIKEGTTVEDDGEVRAL